MEFNQTKVRQRSESNDAIPDANSISRKMDEMNKFEVGDLDGKDAGNHDNENNI